MLEFNIEFWSTFGFTILNIIILFIAMKKVLFGRLTQFMEKRSEGIAATLANAEETKKMIEDMKVEYDEKLRSARVEGQNITAEYKVISAPLKAELNAAKKAAKAEVEAYKQESYGIFSEMTHSIKEEVVRVICKTSYNTNNSNNTVSRLGQSINRIDGAGKSNINVMNTNIQETPQKREPVRTEKTVGRNEPCPCGSR